MLLWIDLEENLDLFAAAKTVEKNSGADSFPFLSLTFMILKKFNEFLKSQVFLRFQ